MEDLAERDVNYFMELKFVGKHKIEGFIPVKKFETSRKIIIFYVFIKRLIYDRTY